MTTARYVYDEIHHKKALKWPRLPDSWKVRTILDIARIVSLIVCILSLYALFYTAFLIPFADMNQRIYDSLALLPAAKTRKPFGRSIFRS